MRAVCGNAGSELDAAAASDIVDILRGGESPSRQSLRRSYVAYRHDTDYEVELVAYRYRNEPRFAAVVNDPNGDYDVEDTDHFNTAEQYYESQVRALTGSFAPEGGAVWTGSDVPGLPLGAVDPDLVY